MPRTPESAVVLFSGGQDSTTCLFWALERYEHVHALIFDYGQRHRVEIEQAKIIASLSKVAYKVLNVSSIADLGGNSLTDTGMKIPTDIPHDKDKALPNTFVPGRNLLFLSFAAAYAYQLKVPNLVLGVGEVDYSGYPDCRKPFLDSAQNTLSLAMDYNFKVHAPLLKLSKAKIWQLSAELGCLDVVIRLSHTCYNGDHTTIHDWGYGCGTCAACQLRGKGFLEAFPRAEGREARV